MQVLERQHVLDSLAEYGRTALEGEGRFVLVSGEAGVGKSTLLDEFERAGPDARWLRGACDGLSTPRPLGPLLDVAGQLGGELSKQFRDGAPRDDLFATALRELDRPGTLTVLAIEDIQWADESTLDLLRFLGRRVRDVSLLIIATYRDDGLTPGDPLRIVLGDLATQRTTRRVSVAPLSEQAVAELAVDSGLEPAELYRLTGGNPFFVTEVVRSGSGRIPPSARDAVLARVAQLSDAARDAVQGAALIGTQVDATLLDAVCGASPIVLDELVSSGVLVSDVQSLRFRHEITRLAVEEEVPAHRRQPIHGGILAALMAAGCEDDARLAHHAEGADDRDRTIAFATRAARRAADLASHREAAAQYERALRFADGQDAVVVADICDKFAFEASLIDRFQDAADARERALQLWRQVGDPLREGDTLRRLSSTMWRLCRGREAVEYRRAAVAVLEPLGPTAELGWAYTSVAHECVAGADFEGGLGAARRAKRIAEQLHLPDVLADALNAEAYALAGSGGDWEPCIKRALEVALAAGAADHAGRMYANTYEFYRASMRFAEGELIYLDGVAFCDEHDIPVYLTCLHGHRTEALAATGQWDETVALGRRVLAGTASPINRLTSLVSVGAVLARRGEAAAWELLDEAIEASLGTAEAIWIASARLPRVEAYWLEDRRAEAAQELEAAHPHALRCDEWIRGALAGWVRRIGVDLPLPVDRVAEPYRLAAEGEFAAAEQAWLARDCPYDAALALFDSGTEAGLRTALPRFESLGAEAAVQATRREMRRRGIRSVPAGARASTRSHPLGLTRREGEVLELICAGHSNAEIAGRLYISAKTVDHHVSAVLAKLGVPSRGMAASEALRLGLTGAAK